MARYKSVKKLNTRNSRKSIKIHHDPYWVDIRPSLSLGYRKGRTGSKWIARIYHDSRYYKSTLASTDDYQDSNDIDVLNFTQAQGKTMAWAEEKIKELTDPKYHEKKNPYTVKQASEDYLEWFVSEGKKSYDRTKYTIDKYIFPRLGHYSLIELDRKIINRWKTNLSQTPPNNRTKDDFDKRARKATSNRILTVLKAILNKAFERGKVGSDTEWRVVKPFKDVNQPKIQFLSASETKRLLHRCNPGFKLLVSGALLTGCRYGELIDLKVSDFDSDNSTIYIANPKNNKPRHIPLNSDGIEFFNRQVINKKRDDFIFIKSDGLAWGRSHQTRPMKLACIDAKIIPPVSFHALRHSYATALINKGVELAVISKLLGHSDTRITERHYAHLADDHIKRQLQTNLPDFGITTDNVRKIGQ